MRPVLIAVIVFVNVQMCFARSQKARGRVCKPDDIEFDCPFLASVPRYCADQLYWTWKYCDTSCWCGAASATVLRPPLAIKCRQRTNLGHCCFFPFIYNGTEYNSCTTAGHGKPWCSLTTSFDVWRKWDECPET